MGIKGFERSLENMVEGVFARVFRSGLRPIELGRRLVREMDDNRSVDVRGRTIVPNAFTITVSQDDYDRFAEIGDSLSPRAVRRGPRARPRRGLRVHGPGHASTSRRRPSTHPGTLHHRRPHEGGPGRRGGRLARAPNGPRITLGERAVSIGRMPECDIILTDTNVSRATPRSAPRPTASP